MELSLCFTGNNEGGIVPMAAGVYPITSLDSSSVLGRIKSVAAGLIHTVLLTSDGAGVTTVYSSKYPPCLNWLHSFSPIYIADTLVYNVVQPDPTRLGNVASVEANETTLSNV